jgi:hypothetical protein
VSIDKHGTFENWGVVRIRNRELLWTLSKLLHGFFFFFELGRKNTEKWKSKHQRCSRNAAQLEP